MLSYNDQCRNSKNRGSGESRIDESLGDVVEEKVGDIDGEMPAGGGLRRRTSSRRSA
jgi:hypothetical protein